MDKDISKMDLDTKISCHILRYATVSKCTKIHVFGWFLVSKIVSTKIRSYPNPFLDAPDLYASVDVLGYD